MFDIKNYCEIIKKINENKKIFLIAEIGINHNGSLKFAKQLIDRAKVSWF